MEKWDDKYTWTYNYNVAVWKDEKRIPGGFYTILIYERDTSYISISGIDFDINRLQSLEPAEFIDLIEARLKILTYSENFTELSYYKNVLVPVTGKFICWKKCYTENHDVRIVKLEVPEYAKRYQTILDEKFRVSEAKVLGIYFYTRRKAPETKVYSGYDSNFCYKVGEIVHPDKWDDSYTAYSNGIHAFMRFDDAVNY